MRLDQHEGAACVARKRCGTPFYCIQFYDFRVVCQMAGQFLGIIFTRLFHASMPADNKIILFIINILMIKNKPGGHSGAECAGYT